MASITKRLVENRPLTNAEVDDNFDNLNIEKIERDGSIPMTGDLSTPGIKSTSSANGLKVYNENGDEVASFGAGNGSDVVFNGSISVGGSGDLALEGGSITVNNLIVTGRIIADQLANEYNISNDGEVFTAKGSGNASGLIATVDTVLTLEILQGEFAVGNTVTGDTSGATGTTTKSVGNTINVNLSSTDNVFEVGEIVRDAGNSARVLKAASANSFKAGQKVKVFGVSAPGVAQVSNDITAVLTKIGTGSGITYQYWVALFKLDDGSISQAAAISDTIEHKAADQFDAENHIQLQLSRPSSEFGILLYRGIVGGDGARLIDVLGPAQLGEGTNSFYSDFGGFVNTEWSTKDTFGRYTESSDVVHFPLIPIASPRKGWVTAEIDSVTDAQTITFTSNYEMDSENNLEIVHDNTEGLQQIIDDNADLGINAITFPAGTYYTSKLLIPSNFIFSGESTAAVVKQLPWNLEYWNDAQRAQEKGSIIVPKTGGQENISFRTITIDGNLINNVRFGQPRQNYIVNLPSMTNLTIDNVSIKNTVGGGIWAYQSQRVRIQNSDIINGSLSYDADDLSPINFSEVNYLIVNSNTFENYVSPVDVSVVSIGSVVGNTVRNCGSGILVYGSSNLVSSPNLIMGPDNEFIPGPDTFNSDYDSINITVEPGLGYESTNYLYTDGGEAVYLAEDEQNNVPGTGVTLEVDVRALTKLDNVEQLRFDYTASQINSGENRFTISTPNTGPGETRENGYFNFKITEAESNDLPNLSQLKSTHSSQLSSGEQMMGLVYRVKATTYMFTGEEDRIEIADTENYQLVGSDKFTTVVLNDENDYPYFAVGDTVKIFDHSTNIALENEECIVTEKIDTGIERKVKIKLPSAIDISGATSGGQTGYIVIRKTFIIAKGRIN